MLNKNNIVIKNKILTYYKNYKRKLPWRTKNDNNQDPYLTLISEIMLQQTQVNTVLDYYKRFTKKWPNLESLASANIEDVLTLWSGLGYYSRARNLLKTAKIIKKKFNGIIPDKFEQLLSLPGIGEYTASAIMSFAFGKDRVVIDTNIKRFIIRINGLQNISKIEKNEINRLGLILFYKTNFGKFAQAIMDFSSDICTKKNPSCSKCFLSKNCKFEKLSEKPSIKKKLKKKFSIAFFYLYKDKYFFLRRRSLDGLLGGMYEVPGIEYTNKTWTRLSKDIKKEKLLTNTIRYKFSNVDLETKVCKIVIKEKKTIKEKGIWVSYKDLKSLPISTLTKKIVGNVVKG
jgi:A/G-specific adenine glycosylase